MFMMTINRKVYDDCLHFFVDENKSIRCDIYERKVVQLHRINKPVEVNKRRIFVGRRTRRGRSSRASGQLRWPPPHTPTRTQPEQNYKVVFVLVCVAAATSADQRPGYSYPSRSSFPRGSYDYSPPQVC
ncbi:hypothetical protein Pcinc_018704 [Petrolisthes cinctipes]|uniref:Uncharacterized protein n=1 Tax=Petrolisthes cinctipes TaxID=88211 RepID=A0AAE1FRI4_PETCI|nr:hypothetical protein Pcinc_018704 [Petrolisthes cinctipes]